MFHLPKLRVIPSLVTLLLLITFVQLGCWQLRRAAEKEALALSVEQGKVQVSLQAALKNLQAIKRYQAIQLRGHFLGELQILLDNQMQSGKTGYRVLSLFHPEDGDKYLLVDRGWIPLGGDRRNPPTTVLRSLPSTSTEIQGLVDYPNQGLILKDADLLEPLGDFLRVQAINISLLSNFFQKPLQPFMLRLDPKSVYAFEGTAPQISMPATKHLGYALQWFTMAIVTLIYFGIITFKTKSK